jgi:hypothetical protein
MTRRSGFDWHDHFSNLSRDNPVYHESVAGTKLLEAKSIHDTGPGLPVGNVEKIFDAYYTMRPQGTAWVWQVNILRESRRLYGVSRSKRLQRGR